MTDQKRVDTIRYRQQFNTTASMAGEDFEWVQDSKNPGGVDPGELKLPQDKAEKYGLKKTDWKGESIWRFSPALSRRLQALHDSLEIQRRIGVRKALGTEFQLPYPYEFDVSRLSQPSQKALPHFAKINHLTDDLQMTIRDKNMLAYEALIKEEAKKGYKDSLELFERQAELGCGGYPPYSEDLGCDLVSSLPQKDPNTLMWPDDFTEKEFTDLEGSDHPQKGELLSYFTAVERDGKGGLKAIPYNEHPLLKERLFAIAKEFEAVAKIDGIHESIRKTALAYADAIRNGKPTPQNHFNPYENAEAVWASNFGGDIAFIWGPFEEDDPHGKKRGFQFMLFAPRPEYMAKMQKYQSALQDLENEATQKIPGYQARPMSVDSVIHVSDVLMRSGQMHHAGGEYLAHVLPNDGPLIDAGIPRREIFANIHDAKGKFIMKRLAEFALVPSQIELFDLDLFVIESATHEMSHTAGPRGEREVTLPDGKRVSARTAMEPALYGALEESKANIGGIYLYRFLKNRGLMTDEEVNRGYVTYVVNLLRQVRFGKASPHGKGAKGELGYLFEKGAVRIGDVNVKVAENVEKQRRLFVDLKKIPAAVEQMYVDIALAQFEGNKEKAEAFLKGVEKIPADFDENGPFAKRFASVTPPIPRDVTLEVHFKKGQREVTDLTYGSGTTLE